MTQSVESIYAVSRTLVRHPEIFHGFQLLDVRLYSQQNWWIAENRPVTRSRRSGHGRTRQQLPLHGNTGCARFEPARFYARPFSDE